MKGRLARLHVSEREFRAAWCAFSNRKQRAQTTARTTKSLTTRVRALERAKVCDEVMQMFRQWRRR